MDDIILTPYVVCIDQREQLPYEFKNITNKITRGGKRISQEVAVRAQTSHLKTGDYTLLGFEEKVAIERKSKADAYQTFGNGRKRFERELERLNEMEFAAVLIESDWSNLLRNPPKHSKMSPKSVDRSILAWMQRYIRVHWVLRPNRHDAERTCLWILDRFYRDYQERVADGLAGGDAEDSSEHGC